MRREALHVKLGGLAAILAAAALAAELVTPAAPPSVTPLQLAEWIRYGRPDLDVIDLRDAGVFGAGHVPGARNAPLANFDGVPATPGATVVVYADEAGAAARGAERAHATGLAVEVYVLERGMDGWHDDIMSPRIYSDATEAERTAFRRRSELSRWFGGIPRVVDRAERQRTARRFEGC